jgi:hypothetical protein
MRKLVMTVLLLAIIAVPIRGDEAEPAYPYVVTSRDGSHYFKMLPGAKNLFDWDTHGTGIAYEITETGKEKELWRVSGWYAFSTFISNDGEYLVRIGNWSPGEPSTHQLAIAFYSNGKLIKRYSPLDILTDPSQGHGTASSFRWLKELTGFYKETKLFSFVTVENIEYTFDVTTGRILLQQPARPFRALPPLALLFLSRAGASQNNWSYRG